MAKNGIFCTFANYSSANMIITALQHNISWACPEENRTRLDALIDQYPGADLYVLTEMFDTGFMPTATVHRNAEDTLAWMQQKAGQTGAVLAGSLHMEREGQCYNRFCFVEPTGRISCYDKRHLFTYAGENHHYNEGHERVVVEYGGVRFLLQVCYDLRFPVFSRCMDDYDVALYVANWPTSRIDVWRTLLKARALENQCYVVGVNRVGNDPQCSYCGMSAIISPKGYFLAEGPEGRECGLTAEINMEALRAFRQKFPVLKDADKFELRMNS